MNDHPWNCSCVFCRYGTQGLDHQTLANQQAAQMGSLGHAAAIQQGLAQQAGLYEQKAALGSVQGGPCSIPNCFVCARQA